MKFTLAVLALVATSAIAVPTPVAKDVVARDAAPAPAPQDFGSYGDYGDYGTYGSYDSYPTASPSPTPTLPATFASYGTYPTQFSSYTTYTKRAIDLIKRVWHA